MTNPTNTFAPLTEKVQSILIQSSTDINQHLFDTFLTQYKHLKNIENHPEIDVKIDLKEFTKEPFFNILLQNPIVFKSFLVFLAHIVDEQTEALEAKNDHIYQGSILAVSRTIFNTLNELGTNLYIETNPGTGVLEEASMKKK